MEPLRPDLDVDPSIPVLREPVSREELVRLLLDALAHLLPRAEDRRRQRDRNRQLHTKPRRGGQPKDERREDIRYNDLRKAIEKFERFLDKREPAEMMPDERLIAEFLIHLLSRKPSQRPYLLSVCRRIRDLLNSLPSTILKRPILTEKQLARATRFDHLTPESKELLLEFRHFGGRISKGRLTATPLTEGFRERVVSSVLSLLRVCEKNDIFEVTPKDGQLFQLNHRRRGRQEASAINQLVDAKGFYERLRLTDRLKKNPLDAYVEKAKTIDKSFVLQPGIDLIADLSSLDKSDFCKVRDRFICLDCYDFGLRNGENTRLKTTDFKMAKYLELTIRPEAQKGKNKPRVLFRNLLRQTAELYALYMSLRSRIPASTDAMFISARGKPLGESGCRQAVKSVCAELGIKTNEGKDVKPHRLRHSLGTLNVANLGMRLDIYYLTRRLRHSNLETTITYYVNDNPLLDEANHDAIVSGDYRQIDPANADQADKNDHDDFCLNPYETLRRLSHLGLSLPKLKEHALHKGGAEKKGKGILFAEAFVQDLERNWMCKAEAMERLGLCSQGLHDRAVKKGLRHVVIGKASLWRVEDILATKKGQL